MIRLALILVGLAAAAAQPRIAITHVTVIDVEAGARRADQTVIVEGSRIVDVADAVRGRVFPRATVVNGRGKFLIPGLWDMHVHETAEPQVPELYIANGVTGVRDMLGDPVRLRAVRQSIEAGTRVGPRIVFASRSLDAVRTPEQGRALARQAKTGGAAFVKVHNAIPRAAYFALADECRKIGLRFVGHTPDELTPGEVSDAGQSSLEHLDGVLLATSFAGRQLRQSRVFLPDRRMLDTHDPARAAALFAVFARNRTWQCPTLAIYRAQAYGAALALEDQFRYLSKAWRPKIAPVEPDGRAIFEKIRELTGQLYRAGVPLLAGTDTGVPYVLPGFTLHDELDLLARTGIPAPAVLRIATHDAAAFLHLDRDLGTVAPGKLADLVLLSADPLVATQNTRTIQAVILNGRLFTRAQLDRLLDDAAKAALLP